MNSNWMSFGLQYQTTMFFSCHLRFSTPGLSPNTFLSPLVSALACVSDKFIQFYLKYFNRSYIKTLPVFKQNLKIHSKSFDKLLFSSFVPCCRAFQHFVLLLLYQSCYGFIFDCTALLTASVVFLKCSVNKSKPDGLR